MFHPLHLAEAAMSPAEGSFCPLDLARLSREEMAMRIGWIGGMERSEAAIQRTARQAGHEVEFHRGHVGGRGSIDLRALVERVEFVVIVTDINSHGAVIQAKRLAQKLGRG